MGVFPSRSVFTHTSTVFANMEAPNAPTVKSHFRKMSVCCALLAPGFFRSAGLVKRTAILTQQWQRSRGKPQEARWPLLALLLATPPVSHLRTIYRADPRTSLGSLGPPEQNPLSRYASCTDSHQNPYEEWPSLQETASPGVRTRIGAINIMQRNAVDSGGPKAAKP